MTDQESPLIYEKQHKLSYYECDESGHPSTSMIISMVNQVSEEHSASLGLDSAAIQSYGGGWVITSYEGNFNPEQPVNGQTVILGTKAVAYNRFFALREFWMKASDRQTEYMHLTALFVYMNLKTRHLMAIPSEVIKPYHGPEVKRIPRLVKPNEMVTAATVKNYHVRFFDIDDNHHVNNARYFDWMQDPLGADFLLQHRLQRLMLRYDKEVRYGQDVISQVSAPYQNKAGQLVTDHQIIVDDQVAAVATMIWK